jgi:hypothetical protein
MKIYYCALCAIIILTSQNIMAFSLPSWMDDARKVRGHEEYDFKACSQFNDTNSKNYYVACDDAQTYSQVDELNALEKNMTLVHAEVLEDKYLDDLQNHVLKDLNSKKDQINKTLSCLSNPKAFPECNEIKEAYVAMVRREVPRLRVIMAQMHVAGTQYSPHAVDRFHSDISHNRKLFSTPHLTSSEKAFLKNYTHELEEGFREEVSQEVPQLKDCMKERPCSNGKEIILNTHIDRRFDKQNKLFREQYEKTLTENPLLGILSLTGEESEEVLLTEVGKKLEFMKSKLNDSMNHIQKFKGAKRRNLMAYSGAVEGFLGERNDLISCDISQTLKNKHDMKEMATEALIIGGTIAGAGACAFTAGIGCAVSVALAGEAISYRRTAGKLEASEHLYYSGQVELSTYNEEEKNRDLALYLAPLSLVGTGVTKRMISAYATVGKNVGADSIHVAERRIENVKREAIKKIEGKLNRSKKDLHYSYNPNNQLNLSTIDEVYYAAIADHLEQQIMKQHPHLSFSEVTKKVKAQLDDIVRKCDAD